MYQIVDIDKVGVDSVQIVEGSYQLTPNFTVEEVACNDGNEIVIYSSNFMRKAQALRDYCECAIYSNSWFRTYSYNVSDKVGGAIKSRHIYGDASDFKTPSKFTDEQFSIIVEHIFGRDCGLGVYTGRTHVDMSEYSRWEG